MQLAQHTRVAGQKPLLRFNFGSLLGLVSLLGLGVVGASGCSASPDGDSRIKQNGGSSNFGGSAGSDNFGGSGGTIVFDAGTGGTGQGDVNTCAGAAEARSYFGCSFYPTITTNLVWSTFDFTVVVANTHETPVKVTVTHPGSSEPIATETVPAMGTAKLYLPWVPALKGPDTDTCGSAVPMNNSLRGPGSFHLTTDKPVSVYQFNALQYRGQGGPPGKSWAACPGNQTCPSNFGPIGCFSFSNDASLLIPSTAWTSTYRVMAPRGPSTYFAMTAKEDTTVEITLSASAQVAAGVNGSNIQAASAGQTITMQIAANEVVELATVPGNQNTDLSGSLIRALDGKTIQVIAGAACINIPTGVSACDHVEETIFPAETLGAHYFVTRPTSPNGNTVGHLVRIYGNQDGTSLSYPGTTPAGAPTTINAGQVVELANVQSDFEIVGDKEFAVASFMFGGERQDPNAPVGQQKGDPSMSFATAVEQYRSRYVFLAPDDYDVSYVDIIMPLSANVQLNGSAITATPSAIASNYGVARVRLPANTGGGHVLESDEPVGIQVMGFGSYTSYQYPGGLNLDRIAPPPPK